MVDTLYIAQNATNAFGFGPCSIDKGICFFSTRLHQPVKNPISDKSNILWNSPSVGYPDFSNTEYRNDMVCKA